MERQRSRIFENWFGAENLAREGEAFYKNDLVVDTFGPALSFVVEHLPCSRDLRKLALNKRSFHFEAEGQKWRIKVDTTGTPVIKVTRRDDEAKMPEIDLVVDLQMKNIEGIEVWISPADHVAIPLSSPLEIPENQG